MGRLYTRLIGASVLALVLLALSAQAQTAPGAAAPTQPAPSRDPFGRDTPRGTAWGFLNAARQGDFERARRYLDTTLDGDAAATLANQLFVVLDARLPARLPSTQQCARRVSLESVDPRSGGRGHRQQREGSRGRRPRTGGPRGDGTHLAGLEQDAGIHPGAVRRGRRGPGRRARSGVPDEHSYRRRPALRVARRPARFASCVFTDGGAEPDAHAADRLRPPSPVRQTRAHARCPPQGRLACWSWPS